MKQIIQLKWNHTTKGTALVKQVKDLEENVMAYNSKKISWIWMIKKSLPETVQFLRSTFKLHIMCVEEDFRESFKKVLDEFEDFF